MQFPGQRFSRPHGYNLKSLKSPRNQRKEKLDDTVETWVERCHVHPRVRNLVPCDTAVACYREIPHVFCSPLVLTSAKFISNKNEHFRGYVIQADDGSNRIFVLSVYWTDHTQRRDRIAVRILEGTSLFTWSLSPALQEMCTYVT